MVFITNVNNILLTSSQSVLLMELSGVPRESHQPVTSQWQTLSHNVVSSSSHYEQGGVWTHNLNGDRHWLYR